MSDMKRLDEAIARALTPIVSQCVPMEAAIAARRAILAEIEAMGGKIAWPQDERFGCHIDLMDGEEPDGCVWDDGRPENCSMTARYSDKAACPYWRSYRPAPKLGD